MTQSDASKPFYRPPFTRARTALAFTAVAAIVITSLVLFVYSPCLTLVVASSNEKYDLLTILAGQYSPEPVDRRCVRVRITSVPSGTAEKQLADDWRGLPVADRPQAWTPAATTWLLLLRADRAKKHLPDILPPVAQPLIYSPLVIAMPASMAAALRQSSAKLGWHDVVDRVRDPAGWARFGKPWGPFKLGETTPLISTSGLHAMLSLSNVAQSEAEPDKFLRDFDSSVVHYADSVRTFLVALDAADRRGDALNYVSAIAVEEKQVFDYNRGDPTSAPCVTKTCADRVPTEKLVAIYPKEGTFYADHPYAILNWPDQPDAELYREAAQNFQRFLEGATAQNYFQSQGFRDHLRQAGDDLDVDHFDPSEPRSLYSPPLPAVIRDTIDHWTTNIRKPANVTLLLDVDESLGAVNSGGRPSQFTIMTQSVGPVLESELGEEDVFSLTTFPTRTGEAYRRVLDPAKLGPPPSQLSSRVEALQTESGTRAVYVAIKAAAEDVRARFAPGGVNAVVVVTTGRNQTSDTRDALSSWFQQQTDRRVLLFVVALSKEAFDDLGPVVNAAGGVLYNGTDLKDLGDSIRKALLNL